MAIKLKADKRNKGLLLTQGSVLSTLLEATGDLDTAETLQKILPVWAMPESLLAANQPA
ncbi:hypothetical protein [Pseudomonas sp. A34-9]|uniref:hypothetical protein n=1 Tax=Pseudomonas sp. A34-9 TaxID=3034675 RepID=UPI00240E4A87|nr:hypothetical protein [Pseudomonas sp. A34-9]